jgi:hypothetical protein
MEENQNGIHIVFDLSEMIDNKIEFVNLPSQGKLPN